MIEESFEAKGKRKRLIEELRGKGISDEKVLEAMGTGAASYIHG